MSSLFKFTQRKHHKSIVTAVDCSIQQGIKIGDHCNSSGIKSSLVCEMEKYGFTQIQNTYLLFHGLFSEQKLIFKDGKRAYKLCML